MSNPNDALRMRLWQLLEDFVKTQPHTLGQVPELLERVLEAMTEFSGLDPRPITEQPGFENIMDCVRHYAMMPHKQLVQIAYETEDLNISRTDLRTHTRGELIAMLIEVDVKED